MFTFSVECVQAKNQYTKGRLLKLNQKNQKKCRIAICLLISFVLWTVLIRLVDVQAIGPNGSAVGFAAINRYFHQLTGVHMALYTLTDWLSLIPACFVLGFGLLGFAQLIKRKSLLKVDFDILVLGGFYIVVLAVYVLFEVFVVNYRPVLIEGVLEASYPSSTTVLVMCVMLTAILQLRSRIKNEAVRRCAVIAMAAFAAFMVIGRLVSGVHWLTDIVGGALLSAGLVMLYDSISSMKGK